MCSRNANMAISGNNDLEVTFLDDVRKELEKL